MSVRQHKLESRIHRLVSEALLREVDDPRIGGLATVTRVKMSPDLREAKVYISILGDSTAATAMAGIQSAGSVIQRHVTQGLAMRYAPKLTFELDLSLKKQAEVLHLLNQNQQSPSATLNAAAAPPQDNARPPD